MSWWRELLQRKTDNARPVASGRPRSYAADSGYVYEYVFVGFRRLKGREPAYEYVFSVTAARRPPCPVVVRLTDAAQAVWVRDHRELSASERYGIAKLSLKRAFDRWEGPTGVCGQIQPDPAEILEIAQGLDL